MKFRYLSVLLILVVALNTACTGEAPQERGYANPDAIVDANWMKQHIADSNIRIIAGTATKEGYDEGHIKGAVYLDYTADIVDLDNPVPNQMAPKEKVESLMRTLGIKNTDTVIVYDDTNNMIAARIFNVLRFYGHQDVRLLNGGQKTWESSGGEPSTDAPYTTRSDYVARDKRPAEYVDIEFVQANLNNPDIQIVDVRPTDQYTGENVRPGIGRGGGHIPGAINAPGGATWNEDMTIKPYEELKAFYEERGVSMDKKVVVYCHNGMLASYSWYVLSQLVGHPDVAIYDGSSLEWTNHPTAPLVKGPEP